MLVFYMSGTEGFSCYLQLLRLNRTRRRWNAIVVEGQLGIVDEGGSVFDFVR